MVQRSAEARVVAGVPSVSRETKLLIYGETEGARMPSPPTGYIHLEDGTYENIWLDIAMGVITLGGAGLLA